MAEPIDVLAIVTINPDNIKDVEPLIQELRAKSLHVGGNLKYEVYREQNKPGVYYFIEQYQTMEDIVANLESDFSKEIVQKSSQYYLAHPDILLLEKLPI